jgi:purine-binding chemotaxis protein CheW
MSSKNDSHESRIEVTPEPQSILAFVDTLLEKQSSVRELPSIVLHSYIEIVLGDEVYLLPLSVCREVVRVGEITRVPESPRGVGGLVNIRGRIIPLLDLRVCLGTAPAPLTQQSRQVIVEISKRPLALLVDQVTGIIKLAETDQLPATGIDPECVLGRVSHVGIQKRILSVEKLVAVTSG